MKINIPCYFFIVSTCVYIKQAYLKMYWKTVAVWSDSLGLVRQPPYWWVLWLPSVSGSASYVASPAAAMHSTPTVQTPADLANSQARLPPPPTGMYSTGWHLWSTVTFPLYSCWLSEAQIDPLTGFCFKKDDSIAMNPWKSSFKTVIESGI